VALILDVLGVAQKSNVISGVRDRALSEKPTSAAEPTGDRQTVLLFATNEGGRMAIPLSQVSRLEEFPRSSVEHVGPFEVVQYRGEILPLIHVARTLRRQHFKSSPAPSRQLAADTAAARESETVQAVVCTGADRRVGLVVDRILDIVEETLVSRSEAHRSGVLFTAVIQGRVTEFLDIESIVGSVDPELFDPQQTLLGEV
jgi:two-component system, chemotaxis family, sensor kinase CheA